MTNIAKLLDEIRTTARFIATANTSVRVDLRVERAPDKSTHHGVSIAIVFTDRTTEKQVTRVMGAVVRAKLDTAIHVALQETQIELDKEAPAETRKTAS